MELFVQTLIAFGKWQERIVAVEMPNEIVLTVFYAQALIHRVDEFREQLDALVVEIGELVEEMLDRLDVGEHVVDGRVELNVQVE